MFKKIICDKMITINLQSFLEWFPTSQNINLKFYWSIIKNHVCRNHTTFQIKLKNNSYTTIMQLSLSIIIVMQLFP
jgi:hypothetical protein